MDESHPIAKVSLPSGSNRQKMKAEVPEIFMQAGNGVFSSRRPEVSVFVVPTLDETVTQAKTTAAVSPTIGYCPAMPSRPLMAICI